MLDTPPKQEYLYHMNATEVTTEANRRCAEAMARLEAAKPGRQTRGPVAAMSLQAGFTAEFTEKVCAGLATTAKLWSTAETVERFEAQTAEIVAKFRATGEVAF